MEKDIEYRIKRFLDECEDGNWYWDDGVDAIENLIKGYRELEEENRIFALARSNIELKRYVEKNYIPKSKIKEKIEELESKIKATFCKYMTEEDYYNNKFLSSDVAEDYEVLEVRKLISNRNLLQELKEDK